MGLFRFRVQDLRFGVIQVQGSGFEVWGYLAQASIRETVSGSGLEGLFRV